VTGSVIAVCISEQKGQRKTPVASVELRENHGIVGDAHAGEWHRQVSLLATESIAKMRAMGLDVDSGDFAENITTSGIDLLALPAGARLHIGADAVVEVTGLRNPCQQIEDFQRGLLKQVLYRDDDGHVVRKAGIMSVVITGGVVYPGDPIEVVPPNGSLRPLDVV
jgi:MOSC domain-containing protein YiiM